MSNNRHDEEPCNTQAIAEWLGVTKWKVHQLVREEGAPKPIKLGHRTTIHLRHRWREYLQRKAEEQAQGGGS